MWSGDKTQVENGCRYMYIYIYIYVCVFIWKCATNARADIVLIDCAAFIMESSCPSSGRPTGWKAKLLQLFCLAAKQEDYFIYIYSYIQPNCRLGAKGWRKLKIDAAVSLNAIVACAILWQLQNRLIMFIAEGAIWLQLQSL